MIRIINLLKAVHLELKILRIYILLSILLLTTMLAAAIFISFIANNVMSTFTEYANSICPNGIYIQINGLTYDNITMLDRVGLKEIYPVPVESAESEAFYFHDISLKMCYIETYYFREENSNVIEGKGYDIDCNVSSDNKIPMWISLKTSNEYGLKIGDEVDQRVSEDLIITYRVIGIYSNDNFMDSDIGIPFTAYYQAVSATGRYINHEVYGVIADAGEYSTICTEISKLGLVTDSTFDDVFKVLNMLRGLFYILSIFVTVTAALTFSNICGVIFKHRLKHIMLEKIMGRKRWETVFIYGVIIELAIIVSLFLALLIDVLLQCYAENILIDTFEVSGISLTGISNYIPIVFILCNIVLVRSFVSILRITKRSDIISVLEDRG